MRAPADPRTVRRILALETALARRDASATGGDLATLFDPDFVELGASGRRWDRAATIAELARRPGRHQEPVIDRFAAEAIADGVLLVTYRSVETTADGERREARRVSIWVRRGRTWRIRFHQGVLVPASGDQRD